MNIKAFSGYTYLVSVDNSSNVYIVNTKLGTIMGYDNINKILRFGNYVEFDNNKLNKKLDKMINDILIEYKVK